MHTMHMHSMHSMHSMRLHMLRMLCMCTHVHMRMPMPMHMHMPMHIVAGPSYSLWWCFVEVCSFHASEPYLACRRSREELSRAALRVRESTARREAAERSTRAHTRFWLSTQSQRQGQKQTQSQSQSQRQSPVHGLRDSQRRAEPQDALG